MVNDKEEKYVTIDFDTWESKYKPMEEENEDLKRRIDGMDVTLSVYTRSYHWFRSSKTQVGVLYASVSGGWGLKDFKQDELIREIEAGIGCKLNTDRAMAEMYEEMNRIDKNIMRLPKIIKRIFKIR